MHYQNYKQALLAAEADLAKAVSARDKWTMEVARLQQLTRSLALMVAKTHKLEADADLVGLQETVLSIIRTATRPVTPIEVRERLMSLGFDLNKYRQPMAVIHSAIKRLVVAGLLYEPERGKFTVKPTSWISEIPRV